MQSFRFSQQIQIRTGACTGGAMEKDGPLGAYLDAYDETGKFDGETWEESESRMLKKTIECAIEKAGKTKQEIDYLFCGDLLRQMTASSFGVKSLQIPVFGVYGACSTMGESLILASVLLEAGLAECVVAATSSHFATAEKEFRFPLSYGNQRPPCATWTVTGSGAAVLERGDGTNGIYVVAATPGKIVDYGITDKANMGACMAPAAVSTIATHLKDFGLSPDYYDKIVTGDLGAVGSEILLDLLKAEGYDISKQHMDCGMTIYDTKFQDVHSGGSGCGCAAVTLNGYILQNMQEGKWKRILFVPTGALLSTVSSNEGDSVPGIAHAVALEWKE
ncbi:MAG: stage V sporulation protein AD [Lachnospiraceae bacterium]|nr:stage V sporulation protein AD [Lachnospiraceae bacterium]